MAKLLKGESIILYTQTITGTDDFGANIVEETPKTVDNVIIAPTTQDDLISDLQLYGKKSIYTLCIPKGNEDDWEDKVVEFWGKKYRVFGAIAEYQNELVPLDWNKKVKVERYE